VAEEVFKPDFTKNYPHTSTRVAYKPRGKDVVTHDLGYATKRDIKEKMVGKDDYIKAGCGFEDAIEVLLGTRKLSEVEQVYEWVSGKKPYLYRINQTPTEEVLRAVVLGLDDDSRFNINANISINADRPARGCDLVGQKISGRP
jgi:hypothetical protein